MAVKLKVEDNPKKVVLARDLEDGQIGIIIEGKYNGRIIQRFDDKIVSIGMGFGKGFYSNNSLEIRILESGELIEVV